MLAWPPILEPIRQVIAIVGCQRSGTTLVGQLLGSEPRTLLIDEEDGLYAWFQSLFEREDRVASRSQRMLWHAARKYREEQQRTVGSRDELRLAPAVDTLVLKAPNLTYDEGRLAALPASVRVVYPVRDPRPVVESMTRLAHIDFLGNQLKLIGQRPAIIDQYLTDYARMTDPGESEWVRRGVLWRVKSDRAANFEAAGLPVDRFRYEDLVTDPATILAPAAAGAGFSHPEQLVAAHTVFVGIGPGGTDRTRAVDTSSLSSWRERLTDSQQAEIMAGAAPLAGELGYR